MYLKHKKEDILKVGEQLLRSKGYYHIGINEIIETCKIQRGTFYNYFKSKEKFALEALDFYVHNFSIFLKKYLENKKYSPLARLKKVYEILIKFHQSEKFENGCLLANFSTEVAGSNQKFAEAIQNSYQGWLEIIAKCIIEGQEKNEITSIKDAIKLAEYIHNNFLGAVAVMKSRKNDTSMQLFMELTFEFLKIKS